LSAAITIFLNTSKAEACNIAFAVRLSF